MSNMIILLVALLFIDNIDLCAFNKESKDVKETVKKVQGLLNS